VTAFDALAERFILWTLKRRGLYGRQEVVRFDDTHVFWRWAPFWPDERVSGSGRHVHRPPWWRPFNVLLHCWNPTDDQSEGMHDHPRWSVTLCLRGRIVEHTPWWTRELRPGSIVFRSRKAIHAFAVPDGYRGKTWTLFIVGRRNHPQNTYVVTPRGVV
jgi:hypothetical protein